MSRRVLDSTGHEDDPALPPTGLHETPQPHRALVTTSVEWVQQTPSTSKAEMTPRDSELCAPYRLPSCEDTLPTGGCCRVLQLARARQAASGFKC